MLYGQDNLRHSVTGSDHLPPTVKTWASPMPAESNVSYVALKIGTYIIWRFKQGKLSGFNARGPTDDLF